MLRDIIRVLLSRLLPKRQMDRFNICRVTVQNLIQTRSSYNYFEFKIQNISLFLCIFKIIK